MKPLTLHAALPFCTLAGVWSMSVRTLQPGSTAEPLPLLGAPPEPAGRGSREAAHDAEALLNSL